MRYWLARLSFSFLVVAFAMGWTAYRMGQQEPHRTTTIGIYYAAAIVCASLGLAGVRERHRGD